MVSDTSLITLEGEDLWQDKPLWVELKPNGEGGNFYYYITTLSFFHFFRNSQHPKSEVFLLRISLGHVNASVVTCQYPQIYNFSFRK